ncbi:SNF2 family N-terminal domain-containing protein [Aspergillus unguis]
MASPAEEIREIEEELDLQRAILQSLDASHHGRSDAAEQRFETLEAIKELETKLAGLRGHHTGEAPGPAFSFRQSITTPYAPPAQRDGSIFSTPPIPSSPPQFGRPAFSLPSRPSRPQDLPSYTHSPMSSNRKHPLFEDEEDDIGSGSSKRAAVERAPRAPGHPALSTPGAQSIPSHRTDSEDTLDDDLLDVLGLGGQDLKALQEEQRRAEKWLEERKEQERLDAEFARTLLSYDTPSSSSTTRVTPTSSRPEGSFPRQFLPPSVSEPTATHPLFLRNRPIAATPEAAVEPHNVFHGPQFDSHRVLSDSDDSDIAEITPREFQFRAGGHPVYPGSVQNTSPYASSHRGAPPGLYVPAAHSLPGRYPYYNAVPGSSGAGIPGPNMWPHPVQAALDSLKATKDRIMGSSGPSSSRGTFGGVLNGLMDHEIENSIAAHHLQDFYDNGADPQQLTQDIKQLLETIRPDTDISKEDREGTPEALKYNLLEHQKLGLAWMKSKEECDQKGGILADDMGLGKTIQAISLMVSRPPTDPERKTTLIVAPVALMKQWRREIERMLRPGHHLQVYVLHGEKRAASFRELKKYDVVLTTFGMLASELKRLENYEELLKSGAEEPTLADKHLKTLPCLGPTSKWYRVILDEAQCIKNRLSRAALACCRLNATHRWCMSGTPMMNNVLELHSLLKFLRNRPYGSLDTFNRDFGRPLKSNSQQLQSKAMSQLRILLKAVLLRRTKDSKIDGKPILDLPRRISEKVHAAFSEDELELYKSLETQTQLQFNRYLEAGTVGRNYSNILVLLLRLRQACCHPHLLKDFSVKLNEASEGVDFIANAKAFAQEVVIRLKDNENLECPICIDAVENPVIFFPCGHGTCIECFSRISDPAILLQQGIDGAMSVKCPNCRGVVDPKKITDHASFKKVHYPDASEDVAGLEVSRSTVEENDDDDDDDSDDSDEGGTLSDFIVKDNGEGSTPARRYKKKGKGKPKKTLAELKKEASKNKASKRRYLRRLEKTWITSAKIEKTLEIVRDVQQRQENEKTIIFSQFTSLLDLLEVPISREGYGYRRYDGSMRPADRDAAVMDFTDNPDCRVMLVSLKAGNSGLNLVAANHVIIFDPFWNPYVEEQAIDRAYRFGQMREVHVHRVLVPETVEDRIIELQDKKRALIDGALDENASKNIARLSTRELGYLFVCLRPLILHRRLTFYLGDQQLTFLTFCILRRRWRNSGTFMIASTIPRTS